MTTTGRRLAVPILLALAGCSVSYSINETILLQPDACIGANEAAINAAMAAWNDCGANFTLDGSHGYDAAVPMRCLSASEIIQDVGSGAVPDTTIAGDYDPNSGSVNINQAVWTSKNANLVNGVWVPQQQVILAHELGHALGLEHVQDPKALMYWEAVWSGGQLDSTDLEELCGLYPDDAAACGIGQ
jgi:hypothetical protein